jgi:hypothetical protein
MRTQLMRVLSKLQRQSFESATYILSDAIQLEAENDAHGEPRTEVFCIEGAPIVEAIVLLHTAVWVDGKADVRLLAVVWWLHQRCEQGASAHHTALIMIVLQLSTSPREMSCYAKG